MSKHLCKVDKTKAKQNTEKENNRENFRAKTLDTTENAELEEGREK